jgi:hypothetical protein
MMIVIDEAILQKIVGVVGADIDGDVPPLRST